MAKHHQEALYCCHMKLYVHKLYTREIGNMLFWGMNKTTKSWHTTRSTCCKFIRDLKLKCHIKERKLFSLSQTERNEINLFETMKLFIWVHILSLVLSRRPKIQLFSLSHRALFPYHICCCSCDECLITKGGKWDSAKSLSNQNHSQAWSQTDKKQGLNFKVVGHTIWLKERNFVFFHRN